MAASGQVGGYKCEFIDPVSEEFFVCKTCNHVAREPHITSCCGETFCQSCIAQDPEKGKECPSCGAVEFVTSAHAKYKQKILALQVHCTMKDRGCEWTGKLEGLDAHLDVDTDNCQYADVPCPDCHQQVQRRELPTHLADACPKRDYNCRYCGFSGTYEVVCNDHWPECEQYPIPCPNYCGLAAIERCTLEDHLPLCSMQEVECDFTHAGCTEKFLRQDLEKHMEENTQKHLVLMSAATLRISQKLQEALEKKDQQIMETEQRVQRALEEKDQSFQKSKEEFKRRLHEKDQQMEAIEKELQNKDKRLHLAEAKLNTLETQLQEREKQVNVLTTRVEFLHFDRVLPCYFTVSEEGIKRQWIPPMYTHPGGYKFQVLVHVSPNKAHLSLSVLTIEGEFDKQLRWPMSRTITIELRHPQDPKMDKTETISVEWRIDKPLTLEGRGVWDGSKMNCCAVFSPNEFLPLDEVDSFLQDDQLVFRVF